MSLFTTLVVTPQRPLSDPKSAAQAADPIGRSWPVPATGAVASLMTGTGHTLPWDGPSPHVRTRHYSGRNRLENRYWLRRVRSWGQPGRGGPPPGTAISSQHRKCCEFSNPAADLQLIALPANQGPFNWFHLGEHFANQTEVRRAEEASLNVAGLVDSHREFDFFVEGARQKLIDIFGTRGRFWW